MLLKASIQNFKGIKNCTIEDLSRINLFVGKNDSGKSTIIEAIYLSLKGLVVPTNLGQSLSRRSDGFSSGRELWYQYNLNSEILISMSFPKVEVRHRIQSAENGNTNSFFEFYNNTNKRYEVLNSFQCSSFIIIIGQHSHMTIAMLPIDEPSKFNTRNYALNATLIDCTLKHETSLIENSLAKLKMRGQDREFGAVLNDIYGKGNEWEFVPHADNPAQSRLAIRENGKLTYFGNFGDGLRFCVGILGNLMNLRDTAVFIEEIESHQHSGSLKLLIKFMVKIARENNLQIFLSTHSKDVWESLSRGVYAEEPEKEKEEFRCYLLERNVETGKVNVTKTDDLQKITRALE